MSTKHTALPWLIDSTNEPLLGKSKSLFIRSPGHGIVAGLYSSNAIWAKEQAANAAFIVQACNAYDSLIAQRDALLEACKAALPILEEYDHTEGCQDSLINLVRAIALAEGRI